MTDGLTLALDTSTAACTVALFDGDGVLLGERDAEIGRGHAEHLVPMIADLMTGRAANTVLIGCGPGSFTGLRVGLAAAHGLAIGWGADLFGFSSLALLAASAPGDTPLVVAQSGGHGELFLQAFERSPFTASSDVCNLRPRDAVALFRAPLIVGSGAAALAAAGASGEAVELYPRAHTALSLPERMRRLPARLTYARAPDAKPRVAA